MKKYRGLMLGAGVLLACLFVASSGLAAEKIGFVSIGEVVAKSEAGKKAEQQFKKLVEKDRVSIQEREKELQKLKDELEKQRPLLREDVLRTKEADYQKKFRDYQLLVKDANEELQARQQNIMKNLIPEIMKIVTAIGQKEKYTMIVDLSIVPLAYHASESELTQRVIEEFNKAPTKKK
ncbi:MAG: OmpH family outer membrane protein [Syntrophales bacterium]|nr:OmpH family outer membrane protein [Syntrophales bacterium]